MLLLIHTCYYTDHLVYFIHFGCRRVRCDVVPCLNNVANPTTSITCYNIVAETTSSWRSCNKGASCSSISRESIGAMDSTSTTSGIFRIATSNITRLPLWVVVPDNANGHPLNIGLDELTEKLDIQCVYIRVASPTHFLVQVFAFVLVDHMPRHLANVFPVFTRAYDS